MKASEVKVGQQVVFDMGYGAHSMDEVCTVSSVQVTKGLFGNEVIRMAVRRPGGSVINVFDHQPSDKVTIPELK